MEHIEQGLVDAAEAINEMEQSSGGTAALTIGTVTSGDTASASITDGKLNLVLPRGATGSQGPKGATGATGPAGPGFTDTAKQLVATLFAGAAYGSTAMQTTLKSLCTEWGVEMPDVPDNSGTSDDSSGSQTVPGETAVYELTEAKQFLPDSKQYIDTGVKLFEDISAGKTWTILIDADDFGRLKNLTTSPVMFHCGAKEDDGFFSVMAWTNGAVVLDLYGTQTRLGWWGGSTTARLHQYIQINGTKYRMGSDPENDAWADITNCTKNIAASLLLGAWRNDDGSIDRYWDGTIQKFAVYNKILTNAQIKTFVEAD